MNTLSLRSFGALCALCALPAMAQNYDGNLYDEDGVYYGRSERIDPRLYELATRSAFTIVRVGSSLSSIMGSLSTGYDVSLGFIVPMKHLYFMPEVGLSMRSCDYVDLADFEHHPAVGNFREVRFDATGHNIKVRPLQFGTLFMGVFDFHFGTFVSYDYVQNTEVDSWSAYQPEYDTLPELNRLDYGLNVGVGMYIARFNMDFTYEHGFADFFEPRSSKNDMLVFRLGYLF